jgi:hypothetical protein
MLQNAQGIPHEMVCGAQTMEMSKPAVLTRWRPFIAAFANSQQILKQVQDDCMGWCMRGRPTARYVLCGHRPWKWWFGALMEWLTGGNYSLKLKVILNLFQDLPKE